MSCDKDDTGLVIGKRILIMGDLPYYAVYLYIDIACKILKSLNNYFCDVEN